MKQLLLMPLLAVQVLWVEKVLHHLANTATKVKNSWLW